jgi:hypothetical protein
VTREWLYLLDVLVKVSLELLVQILFFRNALKLIFLMSGNYIHQILLNEFPIGTINRENVSALPSYYYSPEKPVTFVMATRDYSRL